MKISNSKKQLARIINENYGWIAGNFASQQDDGEVWFSIFKPKWNTRCGTFDADYEGHFTIGHLIANRHQTILSRDEYFHLYPTPDADGWIEWTGGECPCPGASGVARRRDGKEIDFSEGEARCWSHGKSCMPSLQIVAYRIRKPTEPTVAAPERIIIEKEPTIEQLAADYRNAKDYADRKQQEADESKADADAKLAELVAAGKTLGLVLAVAGLEPELVIIDWRDLLAGDVIWYGGDDELSPGEYHVMEIEAPDYEGYRTVLVNGDSGGHWIDTRARWGLIRRPT